MSRAAATTGDGVTDIGEENSASTTLDRFTCSDESYLERYHIRSHLLDALSLVANAPHKMKPLDFLAAYFTHLSNSVSSHLMHRDFKYINSNPATRLAFIQLFRNSFQKLSEKSDASNVNSATSSSSLSQSSVCTPETFHQLCCVLCSDFPFSLVRNAARITTAPPPASPAGESPPPPPPSMSFNEFAHKLFVLFFYSEFLNQCALTFRSLDSGGTGRVSRTMFQIRLHEVARKKREEFSCPHSSAIDEALKPSASAASTADEDILFNSFCVNLFAHPKIYEALAADGV